MVKIEKMVLGGSGCIYVVLQRGKLKIAFEISVTNTEALPAEKLSDTY